MWLEVTKSAELWPDVHYFNVYRNRMPSTPDQTWVSDITDIRLGGGPRCLRGTDRLGVVPPWLRCIHLCDWGVQYVCCDDPDLLWQLGRESASQLTEPEVALTILSCDECPAAGSQC
ncbi:hypothetical protein KKH27_05980 [bacterium]|nr:hypothetical protein [bacterium]MBU1984761.1 hypothetical protein [bacterium]